MNGSNIHIHILQHRTIQFKLYDTYKRPSIIVQRVVGVSHQSGEREKTNCLVLLMYLRQHHMEISQNIKKRKIQNERQIMSRTNHLQLNSYLSSNTLLRKVTA